MNKIGYDSEFIGDGFVVNMPTFSPSLRGAVVKDPDLKDNIYFEYLNYTLVMNKFTKQLIFAASNIDQNLDQNIKRKLSKDWDTDSRIPDDMQLDNRYYKSNDWDRGHMVQRDNNAWGETFQDALKANDDTFYYTNAAFQHKFFNQDEWLKLESYIGSLKDDANGRLCVFTGPIHLQFDRQYARNWHDTVRIPSAFFKIVCYKGENNGKPQTRAFIMYQDEGFISNKKSGASSIKLKNYQVTIAEIENLTGLVFDPVIAQANPLYFTRPADSDLDEEHYPERIPFEGFSNVITDYGSPRNNREALNRDKKIVIAAAMVNPEGSNEIKKEWIAIMNISDEDVDLSNWKLIDQKERVIELGGVIDGGDSRKIKMGDYNTIRLTNSGGTVILKNAEGIVIDHETYSKQDAATENKAIRF